MIMMFINDDFQYEDDGITKIFFCIFFIDTNSHF